MQAQASVVIIGAGLAGAWTARSLRDTGFAGRIILVGEETDLPYDRPPLSKTIISGRATLDDIKLFPADDYTARNIELRLGTAVTALDLAARTVLLSDGAQLSFSDLVFATGCRPRALAADTTGLSGSHLLRRIEDAAAIRRDMASARTAVIIGAGLIGLELAANLRTQGIQITVIEAQERILARVADAEIAALIEARHLAEGVRILKRTELAGFEGQKGRVSSVRLKDGTSLPADCVVAGIGAIPNSELAQAAGLAVDNGIRVDAYGHCSAPHIYAVGDVANFPHPLYGRRLRLECWEHALLSAQAVARSICSEPVIWNAVPWFWSDQFDLNFQVAGLPDDTDDIICRGTPGQLPYVKFHLRDGRVMAAAGLNAAPVIRAAKKLIQGQARVAPTLLADPGSDLRRIAAQSLESA